MRCFRKIMLVGVFGGVVAGCASDDLTGSQLPDLVGTWHATQAQVTSVAHPATTTNLIAAGAVLQIAFNANHTFVTTATFPGEPQNVSTGTYTESATKVTLTNDLASGGDVIVFDLAFTNGTLTLAGGTIGFDFGTGEEPSKLDLTLVH